MDKTDILNIIAGDDKNLSQAYENFLIKNKQLMSFSELTYSQRIDLWSAIFKHLDNEKYCLQCLSAIRILSRDREYLDDIMSEERIDKLLVRSDLKTVEIDQTIKTSDKVQLEALKCLCNLVYNSKVVQIICEKNELVENIFKRLVQYRDLEYLDEIKYFDMKLLFLITAFCPALRIKFKEKLHGVLYLTEYLSYILNTASDRCVSKKDKTCLNDDEVNLVCEILKVLFNSIITTEPLMDKEEDDALMRLTAVVEDYIYVLTKTPEKQIELHTHIINLLTMLPDYCLKKLITLIPKGSDVSDELEYEGHNMEAVYVLLMYLKKKFHEEIIPVKQQDALLPILTVLLKLSKSSRFARKYLRKHILPPLRDVHTRPEQGNTLRNNLCKLLTTPVTQVRDLAADLLFVLCKENVGRMIKYTGYGNAAGLFASRGLLGKTENPYANILDDNEKYSSDSEDSDTEEYKEYKHGINPVVGCYEPPHPDPTAGMSEEQKEFEAMKLVNLMDRLTRSGVIQPCRVGEDGKPQPIEHVLELQEEFEKNKGN